jgi:hypothetical protein
VRFVVTGLTGPVHSAKLRLTAQANGTANGPAVYRSSILWLENWITWNDRPPRLTGVIDDKGSIAASAVVEYDVTAEVDGNGIFSFNLASTTNDGVDFHSRENGNSSRRPTLVVSAAE